MPDNTPNQRDKLAFIALIVVCVGWLVSVIASIIMSGYSPPAMVNAAMMAVLGGLFGNMLLQKGQRWAKTEDEAGPPEQSAKTDKPIVPKGATIAKKPKPAPTLPPVPTAHENPENPAPQPAKDEDFYD